MHLDGFLGINKPAGCTSHDVVDQIRRLFKIKKVGHTGTLDPMATGVLILCLGKYTRLSQYVTASDKKYLAEMTLGIETDTQDAEGQVVAQSDNVPEDIEAYQKVLGAFKGKSEQTPPMHSAVRVGGKRLYELARKGKEVARPSREIDILGLDLIAFHKPILTFQVWCSKGTYVRTLAADMGRELGCGAHLSKLQRTAVGAINLSDCHALNDLEKMVEAPQFDHVPFLDAKQVLDLPDVSFTKLQIQQFVNGNSVVGLDLKMHEFGQNLCVFDNNNYFIGIGRWQVDGLRPVCVIAQREG